jgi:hypothetical protein
MQITQQLTLDHGFVRRVNINEASYEEMVRHPYLSGSSGE